MKFYDATLPMHHEMVTFPGDPRFDITPLSRRSKGDDFNLSLISMGTHAGTHVDSPKHYLQGGAAVDEIPLDVLVGPGIVLDMRGMAWIDDKALATAPLGRHRRVLLKTDSGPLLSSGRFHENFVYLTQSGARYLIDKGVMLIGIDSLSIECSTNTGGQVHRMLLESGTVIVEGALLLEVPPGAYEIICLPLRIKCGDGAPARLLLRAKAR